MGLYRAAIETVHDEFKKTPFGMYPFHIMLACAAGVYLLSGLHPATGKYASKAISKPAVVWHQVHQQADDQADNNTKGTINDIVQQCSKKCNCNLSRQEDAVEKGACDREQEQEVSQDESYPFVIQREGPFGGFEFYLGDVEISEELFQYLKAKKPLAIKNSCLFDGETAIFVPLNVREILLVYGNE